jgi:thiamine-phosphate pyrophosphorylase
LSGAARLGHVRRSADETLGGRRREWLAQSRLYLVCDASPPRPLEDLLRAALQGGVDIVQLRDKEGNDADIVAAGRVFRRLCDAYDSLFIVNDRPDLAQACGADGVHLGQDDAAAAGVRAEVGDDLLIGLSTHTPEQVDAALAQGRADYISVGPIWETPTKPGRPAVGLDLVRHAAREAAIPFFAIGGLAEDNVGEAIEAGAGRIAVVRAIRDAGDPRAAARGLRDRVEGRETAGAGVAGAG